METVVFSTVEIRELAKEMHTRYAHYSQNWDEMTKKEKSPYIRAAYHILVARSEYIRSVR